MKFMQLTSPHNPRFRSAIKLRNSRERRHSGQFLIDGAREFIRAVQAGFEITEVYAPASTQPAQFFSTVCPELQAWSLSTSALWVALAEPLFKQLGYGDRVAECIAVGRAPTAKPITEDLGRNLLLAVVDGIEKPGNLGAILRTGLAAGIDAFWITDPVVDLFNPNVIRASTGGVFSTPIHILTPEEALHGLTDRNMQILAARVDAQHHYDEFDFTRPTAIVVGNEARGLSNIWDHPAIQPVSIPMAGGVDSLNVSVSAAILFYEARRQRVRSREGPDTVPAQEDRA